jgi:hypothetical protein
MDCRKLVNCSSSAQLDDMIALGWTRENNRQPPPSRR